MRIRTFILGITFALLTNAQNAEVNIHVDANKIVQHDITPYLYGSCIEDVNHEIYGGLYGQKIYGESFEEPAPDVQFKGFTIYEGTWSHADDTIIAGAHHGGKLVSNGMAVHDGEVSVDLLMPDGGESAGLLVRVSDAGNGADNFFGYEIGLAADGSRVIIGKHRHDFERVKEVPVTGCNPQVWNNLCVRMSGPRITILLNRQEVYSFEDTSDIKGGDMALRVWNTNARYCNLYVNHQNMALEPIPVKEVSRRWDAIGSDNTVARYSMERGAAYNGEWAQTMEMVSDQGCVGIANMGLNRWGISVRKGRKMEGRLYLKSTALCSEVTVLLQSADGSRTYASKRIGGIGTQWGRHAFTLRPNATDGKARLAVTIDRPCKVAVDQVTLMDTGDALFHGLPCRSDIGRAMVRQGLTFLRYGGTMINAPEYRFKKMIGDPDRRPPYHGHWNRWSTNGFGIEDFLRFCEAAGFTAAFAINIEETPQDVADMVEYLNGPVTSPWGRKRAQNGHSKPYGVRYIGIGNEEVLFNGDRGDEYDHYIERFCLLHDAIKSKDPSIKLINTAWWRPESANVERVFRALDGKADYWDYHPWADALTSGREVEAELRRMKELFTHWNPRTTMKCAIFEENGNTHNIQRMLGHVTLQNAVRRMGGFVLTSCAANALQPFRQNDNGWDQGQVFFTPTQVWGMPPYYAQQMAAAVHQPLLIESQSNNTDLDVTATRDPKGRKLVLHIANTGARYADVSLHLNGMTAKRLRATTLSGDPESRNTPETPERFVPMSRELEKERPVTLPPYSYTIIEVAGSVETTNPSTQDQTN